MSVPVLHERARGCGFRKAGGLYLMSDGPMAPCSKLPIELTVCPTCAQGIKPARGWTWIAYEPLIEPGPHGDFAHETLCVLAQPAEKVATEDGKVGLIWVGEKFYRRPSDFMREAWDMGVSRRISAIPRGFEVGKTLVLLAHRRVIEQGVRDGETDEVYPSVDEAVAAGCDPDDLSTNCVPGVFTAFVPKRIEYVLKPEEEGNEELIESMRERGITPVIVHPIREQEELLV